MLDTNHILLFGSLAGNGVTLLVPTINALLRRTQSRAETENSSVAAMAAVNSALQAEIARLNKQLKRTEWEAEQWKEISVSSTRLITTATEVAAKKRFEEPQDA